MGFEGDMDKGGGAQSRLDRGSAPHEHALPHVHRCVHAREPRAAADCGLFPGLQLDRGNLSNALTDNFLKDLGVNQNVYNNGTTIQLVCFLSAEFPFQIIVKRYGFKRVSLETSVRS